MTEKFYPCWQKKRINIAKKSDGQISKNGRRHPETDISFWYNNHFNNVTWSSCTDIFENIWEEDLSSLEFAEKYMDEDWLNNLKEREKERVVNLIETFLERYSKTTDMFCYLEGKTIAEVAKELEDIGICFGFESTLNNDLGLEFKNGMKASDLIIKFQNFQRVIESALPPQTTSNNRTRHHRFLRPMFCKLLKIYVVCVVDAMKKLFIARVRNGTITWCPISMNVSSNKPSQITIKPCSQEENPLESYISELYLASKLNDSRYDDFCKDKKLSNIWTNKVSKLNFAKKAMTSWLRSLKEKEKQQVFACLEELWMVVSNDEFLSNLKTKSIVEVVEEFTKLGINLGFIKKEIRIMNFDFTKKLTLTDPIVTFEKFRDIMTSVSSRRSTMTNDYQKKARIAEFLIPFASRSLKLFVRIVKDAVRELFTCKIKNGAIVGWVPNMDTNMRDVGSADFESMDVETEKEEKVKKIRKANSGKTETPTRIDSEQRKSKLETAGILFKDEYSTDFFERLVASPQVSDKLLETINKLYCENWELTGEFKRLWNLLQ